MLISRTRNWLAVALTLAGFMALMIAIGMARYSLAQSEEPMGLVVRVAVFSPDQGNLNDYRDFIDGHLFPTLRAVPGYVGTFLGRDAQSGQLISLSFWRSEADAAAGEEAVGRAIGALPRGAAPRPSKVDKYVIEYRDLKESFVN
jgi:hypothetical protein